MNISDLSKIDIKDVDFKKISVFVLENKQKVLEVLIVFISSVFVFSVFNQSQAELKKLNNQISALQSKTDVIEQYNKSQQEISEFLKKSPAFVAEEKIISLVADFAKENQIKIITFSQAEIEKDSLLERLSINFKLQANSFDDMVRFLSAVEHGKDFMMIWKCEIEPQKEVVSKGSSAVKMSVMFDITVVSVKTIA